MHNVPEDPKKRALLDSAEAVQEGRLHLWARWRVCNLGYRLVAAGAWLEDRSRPISAGLGQAG